MKRSIAVLAMLLGMSITSMAADVTGTWRGTLTPPASQPRVPIDIFAATLKQADSKITGTLGTAELPMTITQGTIKDNKLTLTISVGPSSINFDLTIDGDQLTGTVTRILNGVVDPEKAKVELVKAK